MDLLAAKHVNLMRLKYMVSKVPGCLGGSRLAVGGLGSVRQSEECVKSKVSSRTSGDVAAWRR